LRYEIDGRRLFGNIGRSRIAEARHDLFFGDMPEAITEELYVFV